MKKSGVPAGAQCLTFDGTLLRNSSVGKPPGGHRTLGSFGLKDGSVVSLQVKTNFGITLAVDLGEVVRHREEAGTTLSLDVNTSFLVQEVMDILQDDEGVDCRGVVLTSEDGVVVLDDMKRSLKGYGVVDVESVLKLRRVL
jgi:hypothetical protein